MEIKPGSKIENYSVLSILGKGGMGTVYKAHDDKLDRFVAIKVLDVQVPDKSKFIERFKREAKHQAQLSHPNIVTVYGFIEYEGLLGIVMEYVEGESLEKVLFRQQRLHIFDVVYIIRQVLAAIGYAHAKGFVHRDIKPSNIILNVEGTVKIMDFGISKSMLDKSLTKTGSKLGTVYYMSPEQIKGNDVNHLTDIYSIGCTIYEMITGEPPFNETTEYEVMEGHLKKEPATLSDAMPGTPITLDKIVSKCLSKNSSQRYQNCNEIIQQLHELDEFLSNVQAKYFIRTKKDPQKTKIYSTLAFASFVIIMMALTYFVYVQVGELLNSGTLENFKRYNIQSLFDSDKNQELNKVVSIQSNTKQNINSISFVNETFGVAVGDSGLILTTYDKGITWSPRILPYTNRFNDVYFAKDGTSFIIGDNSIFIASEDYFNNWQELNIARGYTFTRIKFIDKYTGFVLGSQGLILRTEDGGKNWQKIITPVKVTLFDLDFITNKIGFIVGWDGIMLKTNDGGTTWKSIEKFTDKYLKSIDFINMKVGIAVGGGNTLYKSNNGGVTWDKIFSNQIGSFQFVKFLDDENVIIIGIKGILMFSQNEGSTWETIDSGEYFSLNRLDVTEDGSIFIVGENGKILKIF